MKDKMILIKVLFILSIVSLVGFVGTAGFFYLQYQGKVSKCQQNQKTFVTAAENYMSKNESNSDNPFSAEANLPTQLSELDEEYNTKELKCPSGGTYYWNPITGKVYCSIVSHNISE